MSELAADDILTMKGIREVIVEAEAGTGPPRLAAGASLRRPCPRWVAWSERVSSMHPIPGGGDMLTKGINHVAIITNDADRLQAFYREVFDAVVVRDGSELHDGGGPRLTIIKIGEFAE